MLTKFAALEALTRTGALLIVRLDDRERALRVAEEAIEGGIRAVEITYSVPGALDIVSTLASRYGDQGVAVGVGTVLDAQAAFAAIDAGARMLVSPNLNPDMIEVANRYQAVSISGAFTPTEIVDTMAAGADIVKLFPTEIVGPGYVRTVRAPLPQAPILPAGSVTVDNVGEWFAAGAVAVGVGSAISKADDPRREAERFLSAIDGAR